MNRNKFASGKPLTNAAICRMIRHHLHNELGWNDGNYPAQEIETIEKMCPLNMNLNHLLSMKRYIQWGKNLESEGWDFDIHDFITAHAYVLNLDLSPLGTDVLEHFEKMEKIKKEIRDLNKQIESLETKRNALNDNSRDMHVALLKIKIEASGQ